MKGFTKVPNTLFDKHLPNLTLAELKLLLVILRQTIGWKEKKTGRRKTRDRITHQFFMKKTGLSRKVISKTIQALVVKEYISITDFKGELLDAPHKRKGKSYLYYALNSQLMYSVPLTYVHSTTRPVCQRVHNKRKTQKENETKETMKPIGDILQSFKGNRKP